MDNDDLCARFRRCKTRDEAAALYAETMRAHPPTEMPGPWADLNGAILMRWSKSGLRYIKERAWKIRGEQKQEQPHAE